MRFKFTLFLVFVSALLNAQDVLNAVAGIKINEPKPVIRLNCSASKPTISPLYVIDGVPVDTATIRKLNPNDILEIQILKAATSSQIYCGPSRGVIVITTKSSRMREFVIHDQFTADPIPFAYITFIPEEKPADSLMLTADEAGRVSTALLQQKKKYKVKISSVGYDNWEGSYENLGKGLTQFKLSRNIVSNAEVIVVGYGSICRRCGGCGGMFSMCTLSTDSINSVSAIKQLKFYPNPVSRGGMVNIEWQAQTENKLRAQIICLDGKVLSNQNLITNKGFNRLSIPIESRWAAGVYFIRVVDENGKPIQQEKFLIQ